MTKKPLFFLGTAFFVLLALQACDKSREEPDNNSASDITGVAQKGPFISGSSVTVYDLDAGLNASGKSFNTLITDDRGSFSLDDIKLSSHYIRIRVDGFYYNEVLGKKSDAPISLYALASTKDSSEVNVNLLTHLEMPRVEYLLEQGIPFDSAKSKAQAEVLDLFGFKEDSLQPSESLNIFSGGAGNDLLLSVSLLLQGFRSEAELTELLSYLSMDLRNDGILTDSTLGSEIANHAIFLDTARIRGSLQKRGSELGLRTEFEDFGKYIADFIADGRYPVTASLISYPENGVYGKNILALNDTVYTGNYDLSLAASLPERTSLKVVITGLSQNPIWFWALGTGANWSITTFTGKSQTFTAVSSGTACDLHMLEFNPGYYLIEYYESTSDSPTRKKIIRF